MLISAVIPTKNRPLDLENAVMSVVCQHRPPDELLVIDQSPDGESRRRVEAALAAVRGTTLVYVHDAGIAGLVAAKQVAVSQARGDIICFLEDDVVLEPDYVLNLERGFVQHPDMMGCSGVVTNLPELPRYYRQLFHFFHRGIFHDSRVGIHGVTAGGDQPLIRSNYLSGGLSSYRREVFAAIAFDVANGFFMLEDIDFSTRAVQRFGERFFINPNARLEHHMSPLNRALLGKRQRRKLREFLVFYKKRRRADGAGAALLLLLIGLLLEAGYQAAQARCLSPLAGYFLGLWDGVRWKLAAEPR
jgi:GT2 family glycosyltransferase